MTLLQYYSKIFHSRILLIIKIIDYKLNKIVEYYSFLIYFPNQFDPHMSAVRTAPNGPTPTSHHSPASQSSDHEFLQSIKKEKERKEDESSEKENHHCRRVVYSGRIVDCR